MNKETFDKTASDLAKVKKDMKTNEGTLTERLEAQRQQIEQLTVKANRQEAASILAGLYINTLNVIHYMHDKYCYERLEMALHDTEIVRTMACGMAGLSVVTDSLCAIRYAKVKPIRKKPK